MNAQFVGSWLSEPSLSDETYKNREEDTPAWLRRSTIARARDCRRFLNEHISKLSTHHQKKMVHSLEERWESAFFELLTARILQELGA